MQPLGDPGDSFRVLLTTMTIVCGVGLLTLRLAVQRGELQRADARVRLLAAATEQTGDLILITRGDGDVRARQRRVSARARLHARRAGGDEPRRAARPAGPEQLRGSHRRARCARRASGAARCATSGATAAAFPVSSTVVALRNESGRVTHFVGVERDITEELRLRDQLVHSERLSAIGELVAGVAHEINNPLQTIIGCVELLLEEQRLASDHRRDLAARAPGSGARRPDRPQPAGVRPPRLAGSRRRPI